MQKWTKRKLDKDKRISLSEKTDPLNAMKVLIPVINSSQVFLKSYGFEQFEWIKTENCQNLLKLCKQKSEWASDMPLVFMVFMVCENFWATEGLTVDCKVTCGSVVFLFLGVVRFGCIDEILCCVVVTVVWTISSFMKCDGVWISCCVRFLVPLKFSWCITVEFKLLFCVSGKNRIII